MKQTWNRLTCLNCHEILIQVSDMILNPNVDTGLKRKILNDEWLVAVCPNCHEKVKSIAPCIYKDNKKKVLIHVKKVFEVHEDHYRQRLVNTREAFRELVKIYEDNVDDLTVLKVKNILRKTHQNVFYVESDEEYFIFECDGLIKMVKRFSSNEQDDGEIMEWK